MPLQRVPPLATAGCLPGKRHLRHTACLALASSDRHLSGGGVAGCR